MMYTGISGAIVCLLGLLLLLSQKQAWYCHTLSTGLNDFKNSGAAIMRIVGAPKLWGAS